MNSSPDITNMVFGLFVFLFLGGFLLGFLCGGVITEDIWVRDCIRAGVLGVSDSGEYVLCPSEK